jgi:hypothetical protein
MRADPELIRVQPIDLDHADKPLYSSIPMPHYRFHIEIACGAGWIGPSRAPPSPHRRRVPPAALYAPAESPSRSNLGASWSLRVPESTAAPFPLSRLALRRPLD